MRESRARLRWDHATLLLQAGRPAEALDIFGQHTSLEDDSIHDGIDVWLLRAETYLAAGSRSEAHDWLQRARTNIDTYHVEFKRPGGKATENQIEEHKEMRKKGVLVLVIDWFDKEFAEWMFA